MECESGRRELSQAVPEQVFGVCAAQAWHELTVEG